MHIAGAGSSAGDVARPVTVSGQMRISPAALPACRAVNWANTRARAASAGLIVTLQLLFRQGVSRGRSG